MANNRPGIFTPTKPDVESLMASTVGAFTQLVEKAAHSFQQTPTNSKAPQQSFGPG